MLATYGREISTLPILGNCSKPYTEMLKERCVVTSGTKRGNAKFGDHIVFALFHERVEDVDVHTAAEGASVSFRIPQGPLWIAGVRDVLSSTLDEVRQ